MFASAANKKYRSTNVQSTYICNLHSLCELESKEIRTELFSFQIKIFEDWDKIDNTVLTNKLQVRYKLRAKPQIWDKIQMKLKIVLLANNLITTIIHFDRGIGIL